MKNHYLEIVETATGKVKARGWFIGEGSRDAAINGLSLILNKLKYHSKKHTSFEVLPEFKIGE